MGTQYIVQTGLSALNTWAADQVCLFNPLPFVSFAKEREGGGGGGGRRKNW